MLISPPSTGARAVQASMQLCTHLKQYQTRGLLGFTTLCQINPLHITITQADASNIPSGLTRTCGCWRAHVQGRGVGVLSSGEELHITSRACASSRCHCRPAIVLFDMTCALYRHSTTPLSWFSAFAKVSLEHCNLLSAVRTTSK